MSFFGFFHRIGKANPVTYEVSRPIQVGDKVTGKAELYSLFIFEVIDEVNGLFKCELYGHHKYFHASEIERV